MLYFRRAKASSDYSDGKSTLSDGVKGTTASKLPLSRFSEIAIATNDFFNENKLGEGGFGLVYKVDS